MFTRSESKMVPNCHIQASKLIFKLGKENKAWNITYAFFKIQVRERKQSME
jgi:hypothetical protein